MNTIITIGRQFGSAGREIGELIAQHYNIQCCDKELLARAAKESGFCEEMISNHDERPTSSFLYNLVMDSYSFGYNASAYVDVPMSQKVFLAQFNAIKAMAEEGPTIFIGRCADYALADRNDTLRIFIYADEEDKIKRLRNRFPDLTSDAKAKDMMLRKDKQRQSYYNYYTSKKWGRAENYDLCVNSSILGEKGTAELIIKFIDEFESKA